MTLIVVGLGYVGLVTAACLAAWGHRVIGVEVDANKLRDLTEGRLPFREPGLDELVARSIAAGSLKFIPADRVAEVVADADATIIAVGTHDGNGGWQTETMRKALAGLVPHLPSGRPLVVRSTLPPEFINELPSIVATLRDATEADLPILLNPEFTQEGRAIEDFFRPSRVICGVVADPDGSGTELLRAALSAGAGAIRGHAGNRRELREARAPTCSWPRRSASPTSLLRCATRTALALTRWSTPWPMTHASVEHSSARASASAARACRTR